MNDSANIKKIVQALDNWHASIQQLKSLNVIRSQKWVADYGEWLVTKLFNGVLATSRTQKDWDVQIAGRKVQVKTSFIPETGSEYTRCSLKKEFDELIVVGLTDNLRIGKLFKITKDDLGALIRNGRESRVYWSDLHPHSMDLSVLNTGMSDFFAQPLL